MADTLSQAMKQAQDKVWARREYSTCLRAMAHFLREMNGAQRTGNIALAFAAYDKWQNAKANLVGFAGR